MAFDRRQVAAQERAEAMSGLFAEGGVALRGDGDAGGDLIGKKKSAAKKKKKKKKELKQELKQGSNLKPKDNNEEGLGESEDESDREDDQALNH